MSTPTTHWAVQGTNRLRAFDLYGLIPNGSDVGADFFSTQAIPPISGTAAQVLGGLRNASTAAETFAATAAQRLAGLGEALTAMETFTGTAAQHLGGFRQAATVTNTAAGDTANIAQTLGGLTQSARATNTPDESTAAIQYWSARGLKPGAKVKNKYGQNGIVAYNRNGPYVVVTTKGFYKSCKISDWTKV